MSQFINTVDTIGCCGMQVQVAFEHGQVLGFESQFVMDGDTLWSNLISAQDDVPLAGDKGNRRVPRRGLGFADPDFSLIRTGSTNLGPIGGDQTQVDDIDFLTGDEFPVFMPDIRFTIAIISVGQGQYALYRPAL